MSKKSSKRKYDTLISICFFTIIVMVVSTIAIISFWWIYQATGENLALSASIAPLVLLVLGILFSVVDALRRKYTITNQVQKILKATDDITDGKFDVKLDITNNYGKYDYFDLIKLNINKMAKELSKNEVLKTDFISSFSHEIKTPLAVIQNCATILKSKKADDKDKKEALKTMEINIDRVTNLVSNILKLNKLEHQQLNFEKKEFDLSELIREVIIGNESLIEKKNLNLDLDIDDITITNDSFLFEILANNLISNAIKFTNKDGNIFVSLKREKDTVIFTVKDDGIGMDKDTGEKIFDKFYQGDTSHSKAGNGLGLALVKKVIDNVGGEIAVKSELNCGSEFVVKIEDKWKN